MTNKQRRSIVDEAKSKGYEGSYIDLFKQAALNPTQNEDVLIADTPLEKEKGLRPLHEAGRTDTSMEFKDVPPNTPFNTMGMKAPIDIKKFDEQGHLVKSYENVPPGIQSLDTGPNRGTVLESPARMQGGGPVKEQAKPRIPQDTPIRSTESMNLDNDSTYNVRGWLAAGAPGGIDPGDGEFHGASVGNDGMWLKSKEHPTAWKEHLHSQLSLNPYFKKNTSVINPEGYFGENQLQYVPRNKKQTGGYNPNEYMNKMEPKVFPNQQRDAQWVNYATQHDFAGRFPGETRTNEQIGLERSNRNTVPLVPNPVGPKELKRSQEGGFENRKKAQQGTIVDYLLPALESNNALDFGNQQAESQAKLVAKSEQDLDAERQHVQRVRANVIPTAKNIASRWENMSSEDKAAYNDILNYATNSSATGFAPPTQGKTRGQQTSEVRQKLANRPESLKEYMPNYNIFLDQPDKFGTNRGVYCTTMGCFAYEEAGARQITDANGHPMRGNAQFVRATQQGVSGFEQVNPEDRQPGDLTILRGSARADYNDPASRVTRDHHTVIYAGESEREESARSIGRRALDWFTGEEEEKNPEYSNSNPEAIKAYSAEGGDMHQFSLATRNNENPSTGEGFKFYRYVGQTPQMTGRVGEAKQRQVSADMVAKALQQNAEQSAAMQRRDTPSVEKLESREASPIENDIPEREIVKTDKKVGKPKTKLTERIANKAKSKAYELQDRRKSKQPKEPKAASKNKQQKAAVRDIKKAYRQKIKNIKSGQ